MQKIKDIPDHMESLSDLGRKVYLLPAGKYILWGISWLCLPICYLCSLLVDFWTAIKDNHQSYVDAAKDIGAFLD